MSTLSLTNWAPELGRVWGKGDSCQNSSSGDEDVVGCSDDGSDDDDDDDSWHCVLFTLHNSCIKTLTQPHFTFFLLSCN